MASSWPDTPFEESMIESGVIIHCPDKDLVHDLFAIFKRNGVHWCGESSLDGTYWDREKKDTCYRVLKNRELKRGNVWCYSDYEYSNYIKCTFYGVEPDVEISDDEFEAIISASAGG